MFPSLKNRSHHIAFIIRVGETFRFSNNEDFDNTL